MIRSTELEATDRRRDLLLSGSDGQAHKTTNQPPGDGSDQKALAGKTNCQAKQQPNDGPDGHRVCCDFQVLPLFLGFNINHHFDHLILIGRVHGKGLGSLGQGEAMANHILQLDRPTF